MSYEAQYFKKLILLAEVHWCLKLVEICWALGDNKGRNVLRKCSLKKCRAQIFQLSCFEPLENIGAPEVDAGYVPAACYLLSEYESSKKTLRAFTNFPNHFIF